MKFGKGTTVWHIFNEEDTATNLYWCGKTSGLAPWNKVKFEVVEGKRPRGHICLRCCDTINYHEITKREFKTCLNDPESCDYGSEVDAICLTHEV